MLLVVPSREQVALYQRMKQELDELVGQINGRHGSVDMHRAIARRMQEQG